MKSVGVYQAKTHLPSLLERVKKGDSFEITRHGVAIAHLVPIEERTSPDRSKIADVLANWKKTRKGIRLNGLTIKELRDEGRR